MVRKLVFILTLSLSSAILSSAGALAAPLDISPSPVVRTAQSAQDYAGQRYARYGNPTPGAQARLSVRTMQPRVYLMRGFLNVFSLGMDDLGDRLRADGISATVTNHADEDYIVSQIVASYQAGDRSPIVLIGHSLGADAVITMAQALDRYSIPVALLVLFDGTAPHQVPGNVTTALNFTKAFMLSPAADFHGTLSNVDLRNDPSVDHLSIDKTPSLQATTLDYVLHAGATQVSTTRHQ
ncbi:MAG TPA: thioesterase domain-containing protein [Xanthobacteraceae bacterium]|jgi:hypothetical protein|nr:thioesterase domain-containing protein [Xanthobacteraceae bacterium]